MARFLRGANQETIPQDTRFSFMFRKRGGLNSASGADFGRVGDDSQAKSRLSV